MALYPAHDVASLAAGVIALPNPPGGAAITLVYAAGGNLLIGPVRPYAEGVIPQLCVFVLQSGGPPVSPYMGQAEGWHVTPVQLTVRSEIGAYDQGHALARALHARLHLNTPAGYTYCLAQQSDPVYAGTDDQNSHRFTINLNLGHRR